MNTMTDQLTDAQRATLARARERKGQTTPAPWDETYQMQYADQKVIRFQGVSGIVNWALPEDDNMFIYWRDNGILFENAHDGLLVLDAPALQDLALAQADIIAAQAARIAALEARDCNNGGGMWSDEKALKASAAQQREIADCGWGFAYINPNGGDIVRGWNASWEYIRATIIPENAMWCIYGEPREGKPEYDCSWGSEGA